MKTIVLFLITVILCKNILFSQSIDRQTIGTTGLVMNTGLIKSSSTVGEAVINTFSQSSLIVSQGFQQPDSITSSGISFSNESNIKIIAYPNPTYNEVILDFTGDFSKDLGIDIYNETGKLMTNHLQTSVVNNCKVTLNFTDFASGNYLIFIKSTDEKIYKSFKVQKIK